MRRTSPPVALISLRMRESVSPRSRLYLYAVQDFGVSETMTSVPSSIRPSGATSSTPGRLRSVTPLPVGHLDHVAGQRTSGERGCLAERRVEHVLGSEIAVDVTSGAGLDDVFLAVETGQ